jgi:gamma-glutamylputrescine oxidase
MIELPNTSYYAATANPRPPATMLSGSHRCDVVVVGGGFTGVAAALAAAERGMRVMLVEARRIGHGASGRNGGQLIPGLRWSARDLVDEFGEERGGAIVRLALSAVDRVTQRIERHAIACDYRPGHIEAAWKASHLEDMAAESAFLSTRFGWTSQSLIQQADMHSHVATNRYCGGILDTRGGHFHPLNYLLGLANAARRAGAVLHENSPVTRIVPDSAGVRVTTAKGEIDADVVIMATDAWTAQLRPDLGRYTIPIINYNVATAPLPDPAALIPGNAAIADSRFILNYYRLSADGRLIFGGGEKYRQAPPQDIAAFVWPFMTELFPQLADVEIQFSWGGVVPVSRSRLPHMGRRGPVLFAHGFSGHGALVTTLAGELMAEAAAGPSQDFETLAAIPHRPFPGGALLARPLATLGLMWYALRDRL